AQKHARPAARPDEQQRGDVRERRENDRHPAPPREQETPAETRKDERRQGTASRRKKGARDEHRGDEGEHARRRREKPDSEHGGAECPERRAEELQVEDP